MPAQPQRGTVVVPVLVRPEARAEVVAVRVDGQLAPNAVSWRPSSQEPERAPGALTLRVDTTRLADGRHAITLEAQDRSRRRNRNVLTLELATDNTPPQLLVRVDPARLRAGAPAVVRIDASEPAMVEAMWECASAQAPCGLEQPESLPLLPAGSPARPDETSRGGGQSAALARAYVALGALPVGSAALQAGLAGSDPAPGGGLVALRIKGQDAAGNVGETSLTLPVDATVAARQALAVPPALAALATGPVAAAEAAQVAALTRAVRGAPLWDGAFRSPLAGGAPRTTGFGEQRTYTDGTVTYHAGYDLAAPLGTPVVAAAAGEVAFAGQLAQRGNAVIVDHGWGIYTLYAHLQRLDVAAGQVVAQGQTIGLVGTTGLSTGPHLHWEVRLRGTAIDPAAWLEASARLPAFFTGEALAFSSREQASVAGRD